MVEDMIHVFPPEPFGVHITLQAFGIAESGGEQRAVLTVK